MNRLKVHIISHTHWDREWFLPAYYTSSWLIPFFEKLFLLLEKYNDYKFVLDGQVQIIEDYLNELDKDERREKEQLLKKYISKGRLFIGPYWAQIDWQIPGPESIVRNLLLADEYTKKYGKSMKVGWLPDTFGQIGQAPQIHKLSDIEGIFVWRGVEFPEDDVKSEFEWISPDGTKIVTSYFLASYRNLMALTTYPEIADERLKNEVKKIRPFLTTDNAFLMNGYDLDNSPEYPIDVIHKDRFSEYEIFQSDPETYIKNIKKIHPSLTPIKGELLSGRYLSVFPGKLSTRAYLKVENYICEYLLSKVIEPLGVFSWILSGFYPTDEVNALWKELILNEIHDNIAGVGVDQIHRRMEESYRYIMNKGKELVSQIISHILPHLKKGKWVIFNTNPFRVDTPIFIDNILYEIRDIPPFGFKVEDNLRSYKLKDINKKINTFSWENDYYKVSILHDGTISLYNKKIGASYNNIGFFLDEEDAGDEYNWSPGEENKSITTKGKPADIKLLYEDPVALVLELMQEIKDAKRGKISIKYRILLDSTPLIKYKIMILNHAKNHRLKLVFPTGMEKPVILSHMPFEYVERPEYMDNSRPIPERFSRIFIGAREDGKDYEFPMGEFVALSSEKGLFSIFPKGLKEYEVHNDELHITLLRSVGWISNGEIKTRTGDAGPLMYTPDAQCIGKFNLEFAIYTGRDKAGDREFRYWKTLYHNPPIIVLNQEFSDGKIESYSLFKMDELESTGLKVAESQDGIILRGFNPTQEVLTLSFQKDDVYKVNLLENNLEKIRDSIDIDPMKIVTLKFLRSPKKESSKKMDKFSVIYPGFKWDIYKRKNNYQVDPEEISFLEKEKERLSQEIEELEVLLSKKEGIEYHKVMFDILSRRRTYLEVSLSLLLIKELMLPEDNEKNNLRNEIRDIGIRLNSARISRRAYEYVLDYYLHKDEDK